MRFLIDTMVLSEARKRRAHPAVVAWLDATPEDDLAISVLTLGEIERGVARLGDGPVRRRLQSWLEEELRPRFAGRLLGVDADAAALWGRTASDDVWAACQGRCGADATGALGWERTKSPRAARAAAGRIPRARWRRRAHCASGSRGPAKGSPRRLARGGIGRSGRGGAASTSQAPNPEPSLRCQAASETTTHTRRTPIRCGSPVRAHRSSSDICALASRTGQVFTTRLLSGLGCVHTTCGRA